MSQQTKIEVLSELRRRYVSAGRQPKRKLIAQAVELLGYHRKAAIRALRTRPKPILLPAVRVGRPRQYPADTLLPILKPIWFAAYPPCGSRLVALLPEWVPAYEQDHRPLEADVRESLLAVSARTLDRLLAPLRVSRRRRGGTRPGSLLRQSIPIRGEWTEEGPGAGWSWTPWRCAGARWMTGTAGGSTRWTFPPTGLNNARWKTAVTMAR